MTFRELLDLNKICFNAETPLIKPILDVQNFTVIPNHLPNIFVFTGVPTVMSGRIDGAAFNFYFDDYCNLADVAKVVGVVNPVSFEFFLFGQVHNLAFADGGLVHRLGNNNEDIYSLARYDSAGSPFGLPQDNFTLVRGYWVEYSQIRAFKI